MRLAKALGCLVLLVVLAALAAGGVGWWAWSSLERPYGAGVEGVVVAPGTDAGTVLERLEGRGVLPSAPVARAYLVYVLGDPPIHAGEYRFELPLSPRQVLGKLVRGDVVLHRVTVVEGLTLEETAEALAGAGFGELDAFLAAMRDPAPIADLDPAAETLEGYLFPETYSFQRGTTERQIVAKLAQTFRRRFEEDVRPLVEGRLVVAEGEVEPPPRSLASARDDKPNGAGARDSVPPDSAQGRRDDKAKGREEAEPVVRRDSAQGRRDDDAEARPRAESKGVGAGTPPEPRIGFAEPEELAEEQTPASPPDEPERPVDPEAGRERRRLTVRELVTLASIVEKEAKVEDERRLIAGVYANRLALGMGLYADPTIIYALKAAGTWDGNLTRENLALDSPYNTYRHAGLPPGPIASPGAGSLRAAADPADVPYLYFVSRNDGSHVFAETLAEHNDNVHRWQKEYWRKRWAEEREAARDEENGAASPPAD
ncbi:MAG TPA: endolytic transglycosylase MltG [Thermoanaerobaculia bacterium]|nr:endolytic transglycosylase MltG [Thermoanaerobaculia bacterium]